MVRNGHMGSNPIYTSGLVEVKFISVYSLIMVGCNDSYNQSKLSTLDMCIGYEYLRQTFCVVVERKVIVASK